MMTGSCDVCYCINSDQSSLPEDAEWRECYLYSTSYVQVYEHLVFKGSSHVSLRSMPGMKERCIRIGSAGKTFSLTAWKVRLHRGCVLFPVCLSQHMTVPSTLCYMLIH